MMDYKEAISILHTNTSKDAIWEIEASGKNGAEAVKEACIVACDSMDELMKYKQLGTLEEIRKLIEKDTMHKRYHCEDCSHLVSRTKGKRGAITGTCDIKRYRGRRAGRTAACKKFKMYV